MFYHHYSPRYAHRNHSTHGFMFLLVVVVAYLLGREAGRSGSLVEGFLNLIDRISVYPNRAFKFEENTDSWGSDDSIMNESSQPIEKKPEEL
jgi:hypothetical protein